MVVPDHSFKPFLLLPPYFIHLQLFPEYFCVLTNLLNTGHRDHMARATSSSYPRLPVAADGQVLEKRSRQLDITDMKPAPTHATKGFKYIAG